MKRHFAFFIVFLLLSFSFSFTLGDHHNSFFKGDVQESGLYEHTISTDDQTDTVVFLTFTAFLMVINLCTKITWTAVVPMRRLFFLNPIFHQSNYVIEPL